MSSKQDRPFVPPKALASLQGQYPSPDEMKAAAQNGNQLEREQLVRLWIAEGIPYAFQACPALFETVRTWLAAQLEIAPRAVTLIGSARLGYSMKPGNRWGRPFGSGSDLDLSIACPTLFDQLLGEFEQFASEFRAGSIHPRNTAEAAVWEQNLVVVPKGIARGAIDPRKIPTWNRYPRAQRIGTVMWRLNARLPVSPQAPPFKAVSIRVYQGWTTFAAIVAANLGRAAAA